MPINSEFTYNILDGFIQPPEIVPLFSNFVEYQAACGPAPLSRWGSYSRAMLTHGGGLCIPEIVYGGLEAEIVAHYIADLSGLRELHLRTYVQEKLTQYTRYVHGSRLGNLVVAHELAARFNALGREVPGAPQTLASTMGQAPFRRGRVTYNGKQIYGAIGPQEFEALGIFLLGQPIPTFRT